MNVRIDGVMIYAEDGTPLVHAMFEDGSQVIYDMTTRDEIYNSGKDGAVLPEKFKTKDGEPLHRYAGMSLDVKGVKYKKDPTKAVKPIGKIDEEPIKITKGG
jgi:hypothetical protein